MTINSSMSAAQLASWLAGRGWECEVLDLEHVSASRSDKRPRIYEREVTLTGARWVLNAAVPRSRGTAARAGQ